MDSLNNHSAGASSGEDTPNKQVLTTRSLDDEMPVIEERTSSDFGLGAEGDAYRKTQPPLDRSNRKSMISVDRDMEEHYVGLNVLNTRSMIGA
jgi:hypothetical protein